MAWFSVCVLHWEQNLKTLIRLDSWSPKKEQQEVDYFLLALGLGDAQSDKLKQEQLSDVSAAKSVSAKNYWKAAGMSTDIQLV